MILFGVFLKALLLLLKIVRQIRRKRASAAVSPRNLQIFSGSGPGERSIPSSKPAADQIPPESIKPVSPPAKCSGATSSDELSIPSSTHLADQGAYRSDTQIGDGSSKLELSIPASNPPTNAVHQSPPEWKSLAYPAVEFFGTSSDDLKIFDQSPRELKILGSRYARGEPIGEGSYGVVFKGFDFQSGQELAMKKIRRWKYDDQVIEPVESQVLSKLKHPNVIELKDVIFDDEKLYLIFELMEGDLDAVICNRSIQISPDDIKSYMQMILQGLSYCHRNGIMHRDLKPNNLFIASDGNLKLGDFGMACCFWSQETKLTNQGKSDIDQLGKVFAAFGTPNPSQWPDMTYLPGYVEYKYVPAPPLRSLFPMASDDALDLLSKMFTYDPRERITAQQALEHRYFSSIPAPTQPALLPRPGQNGNIIPPVNLTPPACSLPINLRMGMLVSSDYDSHSGSVLMSMDPGALYGSEPPRPKLNSADKCLLRRRLEFHTEWWFRYQDSLSSGGWRVPWLREETLSVPDFNARDADVEWRRGEQGQKCRRVSPKGEVLLEAAEACTEALDSNSGDDEGARDGERATEAARMVFRRFGNQSSPSMWYPLAYEEAKGRVRKGDLVWMLAMESGPKCNSVGAVHLPT